MRFTMIILGPSVLLTVKICIRRRQKIIKANDSMMRPGYKVDGMSLGTEERKGNSSVIPVCCFFVFFFLISQHYISAIAVIFPRLLVESRSMKNISPKNS